MASFPVHTHSAVLAAHPEALRGCRPTCALACPVVAPGASEGRAVAFTAPLSVAGQ